MCFYNFFCFASMLRVIYIQSRGPAILGGQLRSFKRTEKSALLTMTVVVSFFLVLCGLNMRCIFALLFNDKCDKGNYRLIILVLNSALNPSAYASFKRNLKMEIKRLFCKVTLGNGSNQVEPCNKRSRLI